MPAASSQKRAASPSNLSHPAAGASSPSKRPRISPSRSSSTPSVAPAPAPPSLHAWLHPSAPVPLLANSPPLHQDTSTFLAVTFAFLPPAWISTEPALTKECKRLVRELDVCGLLSDQLVEAGEGAFQDGAGRAPGRKGKERAREPDHRMWACRTLVLKEGRNGTKGEEDYQLLEAMFDDGEKFGGERVLRVLKEDRAVDVLTVCCRWYGGDMIGPIRFQHIAVTSKTSLDRLLKLVTMRDLTTALEALDEEILVLRSTLNPDQAVEAAGRLGKVNYAEIEDISKLERLVKAREGTKGSLEKRLATKDKE